MRRIRLLLGWIRERWLESTLIALLLALLTWYGVIAYGYLPKPPPRAGKFDGKIAYQHVTEQLKIGARATGTRTGTAAGEYIISKLKDAGWEMEVQNFVYHDTPARNIIARAGSGAVGIIGTHYDTRRVADNDPDPALRAQPMPGANDGASGVGVLLELARVLDKSKLNQQIWLVFFDAEDDGRLDGWDFGAGAQYMAQHLTVSPAWMITVDMVGDSDQQIYMERNSTPDLQNKLFAIADKLGYKNYFIPRYKWSIVDDHTPFVQLGIPATVIIDFDYPYWHTTQDTGDKISSASLERVGRVVQAYVEAKP